MKKYLICFCILIGFFGITGFKVYANNDKNQVKHVLYISSYSYDFLTVPDQIKGIQEKFENNNIYIHYEFMDMKRFATRENVNLFYNLIKYKLENTEKYDALIVGDDNALQFVLDYQEELFPELPVVFLGINDFGRAERANNNPFITGIIEETSIEDNIAIGKKFNKTATKVVAIVDDTLTGIGDKSRFFEASISFPELEFSVINSSEYTFNELENILEQISKDTIVIYTNMFLDKNGNYLSMEESFDFIREYTNVPIYRATIGGLGKGIMGGKMVSYEESGKLAADMVLQVFSGTSISDIPMITESPNKYIFDYELIEKYDIDERLIPKDAILLNKHISFIEQYKNLVMIIGLIFFFFIVLIITLVLNNMKRRKIEKELKASYVKLEETYEELTASEEELRNQYDKIEAHVNQIEILNKKFEHLAHHDYLTNLPNRFQFMNQLDYVMSNQKPGAIMLLDIDNFKEVNDTMGHLYGDEILKEFATRLNKIMDSKFYAYRFGGDEFIVLLTDTENLEEVETYIQKVRESLLEAFVLNKRENHLEFSMGVTRFPSDSDNPDELLMYADTALYKVKQTGKNSCLFYENAMQKHLKDKAEIETILRKALNEDGFYLVYQPQVCVETGEIVSFEALIRLKHYNISPGKFISIAEETGIITKIGRWVTKEVISQLAKWKINGLPLKPVAINFSSKQMRDKEYLEYLKDLLNEYGVDNSLIEIEITESVLLENTEETNAFLNQLKEAGIKIALDDFGTGYSSLNYLTYIPVNKVKLDKSLCDKFLNLDNAMVISSIISLAHSLKLNIIAEGIEQIEQYHLLKTEGCDYIQGYLFSRPLTVEDVEKIYCINLLEEILNNNKISITY